MATKRELSFSLFPFFFSFFNPGVQGRMTLATSSSNQRWWCRCLGMGFGSRSNPTALPCLSALSYMQERAEQNPQMISLYGPRHSGFEAGCDLFSTEHA